MVNEKDLKIIAHIRNDARKKVTEISRNMHIPVTTLYDRMRAQQKKGFVKKHTALLDFSKLGFSTKVMLAVSAGEEKREPLSKYLMQHPNVNSLYRVDLGPDFIAEVIFQDSSRLQEFMDYIYLNFKLDDIKAYHISQELKKEEFLTKASHGSMANAGTNGVAC